MYASSTSSRSSSLAGTFGTRGRPTVHARSLCRPCARPIGRPRSMVGRWGRDLAGRGRHSTWFLRLSITVRDPRSGSSASVTGIEKQGRTLKRTLPSRSYGPMRRPEADSAGRRRYCGSGLTTRVTVNSLRLPRNDETETTTTRADRLIGSPGRGSHRAVGIWPARP